MFIRRITLFIFLLLFLILNPQRTFASTFFSQDLMNETSIFKHGDRDKKQIAFTFDADMTPYMKEEFEKGTVSSWFNQDIIRTLEETHTKATFFITGMWAEMYPNEIKKLAENPLFEIGNHSYSHPSFGGRCYGLSQLQISAYIDEITRTQDILKNLAGKIPTLFRFPGGCYNDFSLATAESLSLKVIGWDVVSDDAFNNNPGQIENAVLNEVQNGSVIVMHLQGGPNAPETADALSYVIPILKKRGYEFVTVSDLLPKPPPVPNYESFSFTNPLL